MQRYAFQASAELAPNPRAV